MNRITAILVLVLAATVAGLVTADEDGATVKGQVVFDESRLESWDKQKLAIPLKEIQSQLRERFEIPPVPYPKNWGEMELVERQKWIKEFDASEKGKQFVAKRNEIIEDSRKFDVKIEEDGSFVVFDVPPGVYGLQGRIDKTIGDVDYGFEIFGQIEVLKDVDEIELDPIQVAVTPLLKPGQTAPPIAVKTYDDKKVLTLDVFKGKYLFVCFWMTSTPSAEYQEKLQAMFINLKAKQPLQMLAICVDEDRKKAIDFVVKQKLREGSHGFTDGFEHRTLFDYGVRSFPSFWLIDPKGKVSMTQFDFSKAFRSQEDIGAIITNRILGKDTLTPATEPNSDSEDK